MIELKECPKCGAVPSFGKSYTKKPTRSGDFSEALMTPQERMDLYITFYFVECSKCHIGAYDTESQAKAIDKWNKEIELY